ncbi:MAG: hypothetical protein IJM25_11075 [Eubacterium sp.]|nr:hypothetical protein [Eubacterium sp.]
MRLPCDNYYHGERNEGLKREAHFRQNIFFHKDENGQPIWKDTFVYAILAEDLMSEGHG